PFNSDAVKRTGFYEDICNLFSTLCTFIEQCDIASHVLAYFQDSGACRVDPYVFDQYFRIRDNEPCRDKISGGRNVSGHGDLLPEQPAAGTYGGCRLRAVKRVGGPDICTELPQHQFCMVAGEGGLCDRGLPFRIQSREK